MPIKQFDFEECFSRTLGRKWEFLRVDSTTNSEVILFRFITGTLNIRQNLTKRTLLQRSNYSEIDYISKVKLSTGLFGKFFRDNKIKVKDAELYYLKSKLHGNKIFFDNLLLELSNFCYYKEKGSHVTAFLYLYRITELISYTFPLHFTSHTNNYSKTYNQLKEFFSDSKNELGFFKTFVNNYLFKGDSLLDIDLVISIVTSDLDINEIYFITLKKICSLASITIKSENINSDITITRKDMIDFIITLRNRYFHLLTGADRGNLGSGELPEADCFFEKVNDIVLNWLLVIYVGTLVKTINK